MKQVVPGLFTNDLDSCIRTSDNVYNPNLFPQVWMSVVLSPVESNKVTEVVCGNYGRFQSPVKRKSGKRMI